MSFSTAILANIGTAGLTLKAALTTSSPLVPDPTVRDLAVGEIGQGFYELRTSSIPYGFIGSVMFYTGTLGSASVWTGVTLYAAEDVPFLTMLAAIKAAVHDTATISGSAITLADGAVLTVTSSGRVTT